ncbi:RluA family pseudouridine synthase [Reichenbachiella sp. MSK19-1]|uniref:RluA family pseudouridine synthase n=1 Tax=Reichenbachiella sp. MSK19-1 TaxID=1897631 RepID=UPI000E6B9FF2|nr:RluA family pseudouridine synthase [Reichenbachiella sp. MSK19-1]RJE74694.1 RNA pseudouridine synthase [Reichenbachiella sp. MSK19-1]
MREESIAEKTGGGCFKRFQVPIDSYTLPERFTFPFYYEPHPLCLLAVEALQTHLKEQREWKHDFGFDAYVDAPNVGKMFGVLLVRNQAGEVGYLTAFSGKLAGVNLHKGFVPPVVDILEMDSFYRKGEKEIMAINEQVWALEKLPDYLACKSMLSAEEQQAAEEIAAKKAEVKAAKQARKTKRLEGQETLDADAFELLEKQLNHESSQMHFGQKDLNRSWKQRLETRRAELAAFESEINKLKKARKQRSYDLQQEIFDQYQFLNIEGETKSLMDIFVETPLQVPPSGAGECALPKMLQYAFKHDMQPLAMAEFWWGQSPNSEIRKHGFFYPSCKGKCEPILTHMLDGMTLDESPIKYLSTKEKEIDVIYEDEVMAVIHKPADLLSVPGRNSSDSVSERMTERFPNMTGPVMVHRLDRATSGLMLIAKTKDAHKALQEQFLTHTIKKRYLSVLKGIVEKDEGTIDLPLRVDLEDRPRQLVCYTHGKPAQTKWKVLDRKDGLTRIYFYPITGRTHQLRVHAAHPLGLNVPMVGDDLYGQRADRLYLHAETIEFLHPVTKEKMSFQRDAEF